MPSPGVLEQIARKQSDKSKIADQVISNPELIPVIIDGLNSDKASIKYGCAKILLIISEKEPGLIYPQMELFAGLLDSSKTFLKWNAILIIANLAAVDSESRIEGIFDKYFTPISGPVLITASNIIKGAAVMALAKPELTPKITLELLKVEQASYQTDECRNIALGHAIKAFDRFYRQIAETEPVVELARRQLDNTRNATRKTAERFLKKRALAGSIA